MILQTHLAQNRELIVTFFGDMDAQGVKTIQGKFDSLEQSQIPQMVLDLHHVDLIDSSGIGAIVFLYKRMRNRGYSLSLIGVHGQPKTLIKMLRIHLNMSVTWSTEPDQPFNEINEG
ncbi:MAG: STAS domain-containing protein [Gammaproteobacteria bacterium]|nr:STAS domain-containing protein [Gammaproteobacteria bacterium]